MTIESLRAFFLWCTLLNTGLLLVGSLAGMGCRDFAYRMHSRLFPMTRETFTVCMYAFIGIWKIGIILFCAAPYLALVIIG